MYGVVVKTPVKSVVVIGRVVVLMVVVGGFLVGIGSFESQVIPSSSP